MTFSHYNVVIDHSRLGNFIFCVEATSDKAASNAAIALLQEQYPLSMNGRVNITSSLILNDDDFY